MSRFFWILTVVASVLFFMNFNAYAYLDPGTGGMIVSSFGPLMALVFSVIATFLIKFFWQPLKKTFSRFLKKRPHHSIKSGKFSKS